MLARHIRAVGRKVVPVSSRIYGIQREGVVYAHYQSVRKLKNEDIIAVRIEAPHAAKMIWTPSGENEQVEKLRRIAANANVSLAYAIKRLDPAGVFTVSKTKERMPQETNESGKKGVTFTAYSITPRDNSRAAVDKFHHFLDGIRAKLAELDRTH